MNGIKLCKKCQSVLKGKPVSGTLNNQPVFGTLWMCKKCGWKYFEG